MALGKTHAGSITYQIAMVEGWRRQTEPSIQKQLPRSGLEQICAAHNFGDPHFCVVDSCRQLIRGHIVSPPNHEIAKVTAGGEVLLAEMKVIKSNRLAIGHTKAPIHAGRLRELPGVRAPAALAGVDWFIIGAIRCARRLCEILA